MHQLSTRSSSRCTKISFRSSQFAGSNVAWPGHNQVLGRNQKKRINKYKDMRIVKHENKRLDKYKFRASTSFNSYFRCRPGAAPMPTSRYTHTAARLQHQHYCNATSTPQRRRNAAAATKPSRRYTPLHFVPTPLSARKKWGQGR